MSKKEQLICPRAEECEKRRGANFLCPHDSPHSKEFCEDRKKIKGCPACIPYKEQQEKKYPVMEVKEEIGDLLQEAKNVAEHVYQKINHISGKIELAYYRGVQRNLKVNEQPPKTSDEVGNKLEWDKEASIVLRNLVNRTIEWQKDKNKALDIEEANNQIAKIIDKKTQKAREDLIGEVEKKVNEQFRLYGYIYREHIEEILQALKGE